MNMPRITSVAPPSPATYEELLAENAQLRAENARLKRRVAQLELQVARLTRELETLRRQDKRQAAPFRKQDEPGTAPKKPGRKSGRRHGRHAHRPPPPRIDETYDAPLPPECPHCHQPRLHKTGVIVQYQTEIPRQVLYRQFNVETGRCQHCGQAVAGRHPLMTSTASGAAASQFGPNVHATLTLMNKECGLSHGKCVKLLKAMFGLNMSRGESARSTARTARRCEPASAEIRQAVHDAPVVTPDETGWRVAGRNAWLHVFATPQATCYEIDPTRSAGPAERLLGRDWSGTLVHDGWSPYGRLKAAAHQQCLRHLQRRCQELLLTARGGAARLPRAVLTLIDLAYEVRRRWRGHRIDRDAMADAYLALSCALEDLFSREYHSPSNRRLAKHLRAHALEWFRFLLDPAIEATNHEAERGLRPAVVNRKVWGGNRTWPGAHAQAVLASVLRTCAQRLLPVFDFLVKAICSPRPQPLLG